MVKLGTLIQSRLPSAAYSRRHRKPEMRRSLIVVAAALSMAAVDAHAQVPLSTYAEANGYLDVQKLTWGQLAGTFQEDADLLVAWYSGWYNRLAKKNILRTLIEPEA
jgi:hypothetical protein